MALVEGLFARLKGGGRAPHDPARPPAPRLAFRFSGLTDRLFSAAGPRRLRAETSPEAAPPDPASILFAAPAPRAADPDQPLRARLDASADEILRHYRALDGLAAALWSAILDRRDGFARNLAFFFRILIGAGLMAIALHLDRAALTSGATIFGPMLVSETANHAAAASRLFALLGGVLAGAALLGMIVVALAGNADNRRVQERARGLGRYAANVAAGCRTALDEAREDMERRHEERRPARAVRALSQAHFVALQAATLFHALGIVGAAPQGETGPKEGPARFEAFHKSRAGRRAGGGEDARLYWIAGLALGLVVGFGLAWLQLTPPPAPAATTTTGVSLFSLYPNAAKAALLLVGVYAGLGLFFSLLREAVFAGEKRQALVEALAAARAPFAEKDAPRLEDVARRIEDALEIYTAWTERAGAKTTAAATAAAADDVPAWRRPAEAPRFVAPDFAAAPKTFRVEAPEGENRGRRKNFFKP